MFASLNLVVVGIFLHVSDLVTILSCFFACRLAARSCLYLLLASALAHQDIFLSVALDAYGYNPLFIFQTHLFFAIQP